MLHLELWWLGSTPILTGRGQVSQAGPEEVSVTSTAVVGGVNPCTDGGEDRCCRHGEKR